MDLTKLQPLRHWFLGTAILGFLVINVPFLYITVFDQQTYSEAMANGIAQIFMGEAFLLMFFFAFVIAWIGWKKPGWAFFIAMSILGSLAFSVPLYLYLMARSSKSCDSDGAFRAQG